MSQPFCAPSKSLRDKQGCIIRSTIRQKVGCKLHKQNSKNYQLQTYRLLPLKKRTSNGRNSPISPNPPCTTAPGPNLHRPAVAQSRVELQRPSVPGQMKWVPPEVAGKDSPKPPGLGTTAPRAVFHGVRDSMLGTRPVSAGEPVLLIMPLSHACIFMHGTCVCVYRHAIARACLPASSSEL